MQNMANIELFERVRKQFIKEHMAFQNLMFTRVGQPSLVFIPFFSFIFVFFTSSYIRDETSTSAEILSANVLKNSISVATFVMLLLITYYGAYRLQQIQVNGQYGYWLALGIERSVFFRYVVITLTLNAFLGVSLALLLVNIFTSMSLSASSVIIFLFSHFATSFIIVATTVFVAELVANSELTLMVNIILFSLFLFFIEDQNLIRKIFFPNQYYLKLVTLLLALIAIVIGVAFFYVSYLIHRGKDIELGG